MRQESSVKRFRTLLPFVILAAYLMSVAPISQPQARSYCPPPQGGCIEYTVYVEEACRCECPNQECCEFYYPFIPYGCPGKEISLAGEAKQVPNSIRTDALDLSH